MQQAPQPTKLAERIGSLDFLRGIAILGILVMNIEAFSYPEPMSPFKYGFESEVDRTVRFWVYFLAQGKFFSMFTLLFGVGFYIFLERLEKKNYGLRAMDIYARRLLWLFIIGIFHAYLIWNHDVLYHYAACGFFLFPFRTFRIRQLLVTLLVPVGILLYHSWTTTSENRKQQQDYNRLIQIGESRRSEEDRGKIARWEDKTREKESEVWDRVIPRQSLVESWKANARYTRVHEGKIFYHFAFFRTFMMMLLGVLLYKSGIFRDYRKYRYYWGFTGSLLLFALVINYLWYEHQTYAYFKPVTGIWKGLLTTFHSEALGVAYVLVLNGLYQKYLDKLKFKPLSMAGKMALTNYISQSIICGLIFYGYGFAQFNRYSRSELLLWVGGIWTVQLIISSLWMRHFSQGPLEWLWRKLTYRSFN